MVQNLVMWLVLAGVFGLLVLVWLQNQALHKERAARWALACIIDSAMDAIIAVDEQQRVTIFNTAAEHVFQRSASDVLGQPLDILLPERLRGRHRTHVVNFQAHGSTTRRMGAQLPILIGMRASGEEFPIEASISQVPTSRGPRQSAVILRDISSRLRAEEALHSSEQRFAKAFHAAPVPMVMSSIDDAKILDANQQFAQLVGMSAADAIGQTTVELGLWPSAEMRMDIIDRLHCHEPVRDLELNIQVAGGPRTILASAEILDLVDQPSLLVIIHDITERKRLQAQLLQAQKMETVGLLAGGIAHDFNNLLTAISGYTEFLADDTPDQLRADIEDILRACGRARALTQQLLIFSRQQPTTLQPTNLNDVITEASKLLRRLITADIDLVVLPGPNITPILADAGQLEQVLLNLVINARDAMPEGGKITIETGIAELDAKFLSEQSPVAPGPYVMLSVHDTGTGMPAEVRERAFEPFFTTKGRGKGTGLGLSTSYGIIKQHNGYIWLYSEPGHGTIVKIYLPVHQTHPSAEIPQLMGGSTEALRGTETILVAEDERSVRSFVVRVLAQLGYTVLEASDGQDAIELAIAHAPRPIDLLLTDVVMSRMGGPALVERMLALWPRMKYLFMSGYIDRSFGDTLQGASVIAKPFTVAHLARRVREVLDKDKARDAATSAAEEIARERRG